MYRYWGLYSFELVLVFAVGEVRVGKLTCCFVSCCQVPTLLGKQVSRWTYKLGKVLCS